MPGAPARKIGGGVYDAFVDRTLLVFESFPEPVEKKKALMQKLFPSPTEFGA